MMKKSILTTIFVLAAIVAGAQASLKKVYDEDINPMEQIDKAIVKAKAAAPEKYVICQVGGNWCPWCLRFATSTTIHARWEEKSKPRQPKH